MPKIPAMKKVILITGASRGIGAATAYLAAKQGYQVCVNFNTHEMAAGQVVQAIQSSGGEAFPCRADLAQEIEVLEMFRQVDERYGPLTALVSNAGIVGKHASLVDMSLDRIRKMFEVNVFGAMLCAREAVKRMSTEHGGAGGAIVHISSLASKYGSPGEYVDYAATKGAMDTFTIGLAKEVAKAGIRVNGIRPGFIQTDIHLQTGIADRLERKRPLVPLGRIGQTSEIANAVLWLLSDEASYVSGAILDVAGGL